MKKLSIPILILLFSNFLHAQENLPSDYLSKEFHAERREALRKLMPANTVAVIFSYPERTFSNDVKYVYHQNPNFYYFSGYNEPEGMLLIFKEPQQKNGINYKEVLFVRKRDPQKEIWTGRRLGVEGVKNKLGFSNVYEASDFENFDIDFNKFSAVLWDDIPDDISHSFFHSFIQKAHIPSPLEIEIHDELNLIANYTNIYNLSRYIKREKEKGAKNELFDQNSFIQALLNNPDETSLELLKKKIQEQKEWGSDTFKEMIKTLREVKTPEELTLLRKAINISCAAHVEAMKAVMPDISEREMEGVHIYVHKKYGAEEEGYPPIVGVGNNGCILHYQENSALRLNNQLLLMDVASEYHGYTADITRTIPANGKFTPEQKAIYQLVYKAQEEVFKLCKEGTSFDSLDEKAKEVLAEGLLQLGIILKKEDISIYYPHICSHHMGLDVHDKSHNGILKENMIITVEPGIYIPAGSACDKKWWNIGVRIEDDIRIGKEQCEILSASAPRKWEDVERKIAEKSKFNELLFPQL